MLSPFECLYRNFILPEICKPCLFLSLFQFAKLILPYHGVFDLTQNDNDSLGVNDGSINSAKVENYRNGLDYSDEVQAYEDVSAVFESENVLLDLCLEDFSRNYEMSDKDIFEYSEEVIENLSEMQKHRI